MAAAPYVLGIDLGTTTCRCMIFDLAGNEIAGAYVVERCLGRGASGVVYAARRKREGDVVALKIIHPELCHSRQVFGRYKREATILKMLKGDRIVKTQVPPARGRHSSLITHHSERLPPAVAEAHLSRWLTCQRAEVLDRVAHWEQRPDGDVLRDPQNLLDLRVAEAGDGREHRAQSVRSRC